VQTALAVPRSWDWDKPGWRYPDLEQEQRLEDDYRSQFGGELFGYNDMADAERASDDGSEESSEVYSEENNGI